MTAAPGPAPAWRRVPRGVVVVGVVSLCMDASSELIHALLPLLLVGPLGVGVAAVGLIEGIAEATASVTKVFSGALADRTGRPKRLALLGYGLGALAKPVFPLAGSAAVVLGARFADRVGKGIRGAPRDALVAELTLPALRGTAYGVRQALDSVGAFVGPLLAVGLMLAYHGRIRAVLWWGVVPALLAVALLAVAVPEPRVPESVTNADDPRRPRAGPPARPPAWPLRRAELAGMGPGYGGVVGVGAVFTLARFSEAFLVLGAQAVGLPLARVPLVLVAMNVAYALTATPAGTLSDRVGRRAVLAAGMGTLAVADGVLACGVGRRDLLGVVGLFAGTALWGVHLALTQGVLAALVADVAPGGRRGTAFGVFHLASGIALLLASAGAGALWEGLGPRATFAAGGALAVAALMSLAWLARPRARA